MALSLVLIIPQQGFAKSKDSQPQPEFYYDELTGDTITGMFRVTENGLQEISFEEFKALRAASMEAEKEEMSNQVALNSTIDPQSTIAPRNQLRLEYDELSNTRYSGLSYKVVPTKTCPSNAPQICENHVNWTASETEQWSANLDTEFLRSIVRANAGFTWSKTASISDTYVLYIPKGGWGEVWFTPYYNKSAGYLKTYGGPFLDQLIGNDYVEGKSPAKLQNGLLDGLIWAKVYP